MWLDYDSLTKIVATQKPFRGRAEHYPTHGRAYRRHSHKYFSVDAIDNEVVFRINYGNQYKKIVVTPEQADLLKKLGKDIQSSNKIMYHEDSQTWTESKEQEYYYYNVIPEEVGIVRPDNTFEFTHEGNLGQGIRHYLENYCFKHTTVSADCRRGGVVLDWNIPLFKGLRISLDTMKPAEGQNIELFKKVINRAAAKELFDGYREMLSVSKVMLSQMSDELFVKTLREVLTEQGVVWEWKANDNNHKFTSGADVVRKADELRLKGDYFDSAMLYGYGYDLGGIVWRIRHSHTWVRRESFNNMDKHLRKVVYEHKKPFDLKPMEYGGKLSDGRWGFVVKKDGIAVNQYSY